MDRKYISLLFRDFAFVRNVNILLPRLRSVLARGNKDVVRGSKLHGLDRRSQEGRKARCMCLCIRAKETQDLSGKDDRFYAGQVGEHSQI